MPLSNDRPAFPPDDNVKMNSFVQRLADIEARLINQRDLLVQLANEFKDLKERYSGNNVAHNTRDHLETVTLAVNAVMAKVASIDDGRVVNSLLH